MSNSAISSGKLACRLLRKDLLDFLAIFVRRRRGVSKPWLWSGEMVYAGDFTLSLSINLTLTDSPQYYDLPMLESTLECLVEITAISGFSTASKLVDPTELCKDILTSLLQVSKGLRSLVDKISLLNIRYIEIINNTRGGIEGKIGEPVNGGKFYSKQCKSRFCKKKNSFKPQREL